MEVDKGCCSCLWRCVIKIKHITLLSMFFGIVEGDTVSLMQLVEIVGNLIQAMQLEIQGTDEYGEPLCCGIGVQHFCLGGILLANRTTTFSLHFLDVVLVVLDGESSAGCQLQLVG